ncbi:MAG: HlyC/CorC family transporter [Candidatus Zixiibacteriota bacterium]|nr:MAG: HlyC/CorC family transporter [candidate division Zixibacteria bacterium]
MSNNIYLEIGAILLLILANGFFSLSEFSIIASRRSSLKRLVKIRKKGAVRAERIHSHPESFLATVQVGITFVGTIAGVFSGMTIVDAIIPAIKKIPIGGVAEIARTIAFVVVVVSISFLSIVIGELVPKYIALSRPERIATLVSGPMTLFIKVGSLLVRLLSGTAKGITWLLGLRRISERSSITEEEINMIIAEGREKGVFDKTEQELIHSVFDFSDTTARQAMTPRTEIIGVNIESSREKILQIVTEYGFSRYPVYRGTLDQIVGIIYTKDIIKIQQHSELFAIGDIIRKPLFVPDSMLLNVLLRLFQQKRVHAAVVLDEFGGTAGMITLEDLLEEIVGEIQDEHDTSESEFVPKTKNIAFAAGSLRVDELNDQFDTDLPEGGADTLGGLIFETLGRLPAKGEEITIGSVKLGILEIEGNRLRRLRVEKLQAKRKRKA